MLLEVLLIVLFGLTVLDWLWAQDRAAAERRGRQAAGQLWRYDNAR